MIQNQYNLHDKLLVIPVILDCTEILFCDKRKGYINKF
jgi:hypothetical protein